MPTCIQGPPVDVDFSCTGHLGLSLPLKTAYRVRGRANWLLILSLATSPCMTGNQGTGVGLTDLLALFCRQALEHGLCVPAPSTEPPQPHSRDPDVCEQGSV